jgi:ribosomal protein S18 acetylase RimI-like enzyme
MIDQPHFLPASSFTLDALADIFTRSFEDYFYPGVTSAEQLSRRVRIEQIELHRSLVMLLDDTPAGQALVALRGDHAWCGGFGVMKPLRGHGLAHALAQAMLEQARQAGARSFSLEVLTRNEPAIKAYKRVGLRTRRDLQILEWRRPAPDIRRPPAPGRSRTEAVEMIAEPRRLLERFVALHPTRAAWQRDLPALLARGGFQGLAVQQNGVPAAYVLFQASADGGARIEDLGAARVELVAPLLAALQARSSRILTINEPAESPLTAAFLSAGFVETDRQHELWIEL